MKIVMRAYKSHTRSLKDQISIPCCIHIGEELKVNTIGNVFNEIIDLLVLGEKWTPRSIKPQIYMKREDFHHGIL